MLNNKDGGNMLLRFYTSLCFLLLYSFTLHAEEIDTNNLVNIMGKQTMLTQKILKDYCMIGMKITYKNPKEDLNKAMEEFSNALTILNDHKLNNEIQLNLNVIQDKWKKIQIILNQEVKKEKVKSLWTEMEDLVELSNNILNILVQKNDKTKLINILSKQRMRSQRIIALYMIEKWTGVKYKNELDNTVKDFDATMTILEKASYSDDEVTTIINKIKNVFFFVQMQTHKAKFTPSLLYRKTNEITNEMNILIQKHIIIKGK